MVEFSSLQSSTKTGKQIFELSEGDEVIGLKEINGNNIIVLSSSFKMLIFSVKELPLLKKGKGVRLQRYKGETLLDAMIFSQSEKDNFILKKIFAKHEDMGFWTGKRGLVGKMLPKKLLKKKMTSFEDLL